MAQAAVFLVSDESSFVVGTEWQVDGGAAISEGASHFQIAAVFCR